MPRSNGIGTGNPARPHGRARAARWIGLGVVAAVGLVAVQGCATYTTPASGARLKALVKGTADEDIGALMEVELVYDGPVTFLLEEAPPASRG